MKCGVPSVGLSLGGGGIKVRPKARRHRIVTCECFKKIFNLGVMGTVSRIWLIAMGLVPMCQAADLELTGLIDIGGCRLACVRELATANLFCVRTGETFSGGTLREMDAKAGWAIFEVGTNLFKLTLSSYCSSAPSQTFAGARQVARTRPAFFTNRTLAQGNQSPSRDPSNVLQTSSQLDLNEATIAQFSAGDHNQPKTASSPSNASNSDRQGSDTQGQGSSMQNEVPDAPGDVTYPQSASAYTERERFRVLYGTAALMAWDLAQAKAQEQ